MVNAVFALEPERHILRADLMSGSEKSEVDLFTEAVQLPVEQRLAFLRSACGGDAELRANVEALLKAHQESGEPSREIGRAHV